MKEISMKKTSEYKKKQGCQFALFVFFVSQLFVIFQENIPAAEYVSLIICFVFSLLITKKISNIALKYAISICAILLLGIFFSYFAGVNNNNFFLCIAFALKVFMFCNIAYDSKPDINYSNLTFFFGTILTFATISCMYNLFINFEHILELNLNMNAYMAIFSSFYSGRNTFASFLVIYLLICMYQMAATKKKRYYMVFVLLLVNLILTFSRASLLFFAVTIFLFVLKQSRVGIWKKVVLILGGTLFLIVSIVLLERYYIYIDHFLIRSNYGDSYRILYWTTALEKLLLSPVFGMGAGCAEFVLAPLGNIAGSSFHNTFIEVMLWGGASFFFFYLFIYRQIINALKHIKKFDRIFYDLYTSIFIGFLVYCFFETSMLFALGARADFITVVLFLIPVFYSKSFKGDSKCVTKN